MSFDTEREAAISILVSIFEDANEATTDRIGAAHVLLTSTTPPQAAALPDMGEMFAQMDAHFDKGEGPA